MDSDKNSESHHLSWNKLWKSFLPWEKAIFAFFVIAGLVAGLQLFGNQQKSLTDFKPAFGGIYREGLIGQPRFLNPLYSPANNPDQDIIELVFSGLMKYDDQGNLVPDLAERYEISEDGRSYHFFLRDNIFWHDHQPITADDVIFTINTIQNPEYKSPLRAGWLGVRAEKISNQEITITIDAPYNSFLETTTTKIIPRHIWKETPALTFPLAVSSTLSFIGSGPYRFQSLDLDNQKKVQSLNLEFFDRYYINQLPYIAQISFRFYDNEDALINAAQRNEIDAFSASSYQDFPESRFIVNEIEMPRYFSVFFNPENSQLIAINAIRRALGHGINKELLMAEAGNVPGQIIDSPILPSFYEFSEPTHHHEYNPEKAIDILEGLGYTLNQDTGYREKQPTIESDVFKSDLRSGSQGSEVRALQECLAKFPEIYPDGEVTGNFGPKTKEAVNRFQEKYYEDILAPWGFTEGTGLVSRTTRSKLNEVCFQEERQSIVLEFGLTTIDQPHLIKLAQGLRNQWKNIGVKVNLEYLPTSELESAVISPRKYEALLIGQVLGMIPDPLPFWHSSRKREPGVNLSLYQNEQADKILEEARTTLDQEKQQELLEKFQDIVIGDLPAIFLYRLNYLHFVSPEIKGYEVAKISTPSKRFSNIANWYIRLKRVWRD
jgi:ABC-type transport system substrate-binding protein